MLSTARCGASPISSTTCPVTSTSPARALRQRVADGVYETFDVGQSLLLAFLLDEARVAGQVGERDRDLDAPVVRVAVDVHLHVADDVLLREVLEVVLVDVVHDRRRQREQTAAQV